MRPPSLHEVQRGFWRSIAEHPGCSRSDFDSSLAAAVRPDARLDSAGRIQVYADAYFLRLRDVLIEDFPTVAKVLGAERFERLAQNYLEAFPSEHPSVRHLGRSMADFIDVQSDVPPYLSALARLEWAMIDAFDAPDSSPLAAESLRDIEADRWPALKFVPIPALRMIHSGWLIHKLWSDEKPGAISAAPISLRIWRGRDYQVRHAPMDSLEAEALKRLIDGAPFAMICDAYADLREDDAARESIATFARWLGDGLIASVA
jgi:hypothetical protein